MISKRLSIIGLFVATISYQSACICAADKGAVSGAYHSTKEFIVNAFRQSGQVLFVNGVILAIELMVNRIRAGAYGNREQAIPFPQDVPDDKGHLAPGTVPPVIEGIVRLINEPQRLIDSGAHLWKGILLTGKTGVSKTDLGYYIARQTGAQVMHQSAASLIEAAQGSGAGGVRQLFERAYKPSLWSRIKSYVKSLALRALRREPLQQKPIVLILDGINAIGCSRKNVVSPEEQVRETERVGTLEQLLTELDGAHEQTVLPKIFVVGTTNKPLVAKIPDGPKAFLDEALFRPGRLVPLHIQSLNQAGREAVLRFRGAGYNIADRVKLKFGRLAAQTKGLNGAGLTDLFNTAALKAALDGRSEIFSGDMNAALRHHKNPYGQHRVQR